MVDRYRAGEISYEDAHTQLVGKILEDASRGARDEATRNALVDEVSGYVSQIEEISQGQPATNEAQGKSAQTEENLSLSQVDRRLRELKKQRKQDIADEVERMERNPGGKGVEVSYVHDSYNPVTGKGEGQIIGRGAVSNNPEWYQRAYKKYGRKPKKSEYADIAEDSLKQIQEFDERDREIARLEGLRRQMKENASRNGQEKSTQNQKKSVAIELFFF